MSTRKRKTPAQKAAYKALLHYVVRTARLHGGAAIATDAEVVHDLDISLASLIATRRQLVADGLIVTNQTRRIGTASHSLVNATGYKVTPAGKAALAKLDPKFGDGAKVTTTSTITTNALSSAGYIGTKFPRSVPAAQLLGYLRSWISKSDGMNIVTDRVLSRNLGVSYADLTASRKELIAEGTITAQKQNLPSVRRQQQLSREVRYLYSLTTRKPVEGQG
jgi:hypothetical protein